MSNTRIQCPDCRLVRGNDSCGHAENRKLASAVQRALALLRGELAQPTIANSDATPALAEAVAVLSGAAPNRHA